MTSRRDRIMAKIAKRLRVDPETGCHIWTGPDSGKKGRGRGYPRMCLDGQTVAVHLVVWTHYNGYIPGKKQIDHKCKRRMCCNPEHLQMVSHKKNQRLKRVAPMIQCLAPKLDMSAAVELVKDMTSKAIETMRIDRHHASHAMPAMKMCAHGYTIEVDQHGTPICPQC